METASPEAEVKGQPEVQNSEIPHCSSQIELPVPESTVYDQEEEIRIKNRAFSIDLIWRKLGLCLNYGDLKALRLVNSQFNQFVLNETNFTRRTVVVLHGNRLSRLEFGRTTHQYRHFKIIYGFFNNGGEEKIDWLYPLLNSAQSLEITTKTGIMASYKLDKLLEASERLEKLTVQAAVLADDATASSLSVLSDGAKKTLENLQEFHLSQWSGNVRQGDLDDADFITALSLLSVHLKNLRVIKIDPLADRFRFYEGIEHFQEKEVDNDVPPGCQGIISLIEQNQNNIVELYVKEVFLCNRSSTSKMLLKMDFPHLKSLTLRLAEGFTNQLVNFLDKLSLSSTHLQELDLTVIPSLPKMILLKIGEKCGHLKKLHIKTKAIGTLRYWAEDLEDEDNFDPHSDGDGLWEFLKGMTKLTDFALEFIPTTTWANHVPLSCHQYVLTRLPSSVRKIRLKNVPTHCYFSLPEFLGAFEFHSIDCGELTHLEIVGMKSSINNTSMEFICRNMSKLEHLNIVGSSDGLTNFGLTGKKAKKGQSKGRKKAIPASSAGFSLKDLKGLKSLSLSGGNLTNAAFKTALKFQELKYLQLELPDCTKNKHLNSEAIDWILKNNPSLEVLETTGKSDKIVFKPLSEMKKLNSRLKEHIKLPVRPRDDDESDESDSWDCDDDEDEYYSDYPWTTDYERDSDDCPFDYWF